MIFSDDTEFGSSGFRTHEIWTVTLEPEILTDSFVKYSAVNLNTFLFSVFHIIHDSRCYCMFLELRMGDKMNRPEGRW